MSDQEFSEPTSEDEDGVRNITAYQVPFGGTTFFAPDDQLQGGTRFAWIPVPSGLRYEVLDAPDGEPYFVYVLDSVNGISRVGFPLNVARKLLDEAEEKLSEAETRAKLVIAREMPRQPPMDPTGNGSRT